MPQNPFFALSAGVENRDRNILNKKFEFDLASCAPQNWVDSEPIAVSLFRDEERHNPATQALCSLQHLPKSLALAF